MKFPEETWYKYESPEEAGWSSQDILFRLIDARIETENDNPVVTPLKIED